MRVWPVFGFFAALLAAATVVLLAEAADQTAGRWIAFGMFCGALVFSGVTWLVARQEGIGRRLDQRGPVTPGDSLPIGVRWTFEQYARAVSAEVIPQGGLVYADPKREIIRVMFDPAASIRLVTSAERATETSPGGTRRRWQGLFLQIRASPGNRPRVRVTDATVGARFDESGRLVPVWSRSWGASQTTAEAIARAKVGRSSTGVTLSTRHFEPIALGLAAEAGWIDRSEVPAPPPQGSSPPSPENAERTAADPGRTFRVFHLVGGGVLAACVVATLVGLAFGMPWWASFIIVGSGLFFCLVFTLPVLLLQRLSERSPHRPPRGPLP